MCPIGNADARGHAHRPGQLSSYALFLPISGARVRGPGRRPRPSVLRREPSTDPPGHDPGTDAVSRGDRGPSVAQGSPYSLHMHWIRYRPSRETQSDSHIPTRIPMSISASFSRIEVSGRPPGPDSAGSVMRRCPTRRWGESISAIAGPRNHRNRTAIQATDLPLHSLPEPGPHGPREHWLAESRRRTWRRRSCLWWARWYGPSESSLLTSHRVVLHVRFPGRRGAVT